MVRSKSSVPKRKSETSLNKTGSPKRKRSKIPTIECIANGKTIKVTKNIWKDIRQLQRTTTLCIPKLPFSRVIREILMEFTTPDMRVQKNALSALHEACELYLVQLFEDANRLAQHAKRATVRPIDFRTVVEVKGVQDPVYRYYNL